jgi:hypothetical protein
MTAFDNKEKAEENKYAHDKEVEFRIYARYHSLLAGWVAELLGWDSAQKEAYKNTLVTSGASKHDNEVLFHKIHQDFKAGNLHMKDHDIHQKMHDLLLAAKQQVMG